MAIRKAERFHDLSTGVQELDRLKAYLADWQEWEGRYKVDNGVPNAVPWARFMKDYMPSGDNEASGRGTINEPAMKIIDAGLAELREKTPEQALAISWRYLNVKIGAYVARFKRLEGISIMQLDELADQAERALLPIVKRKGLVL